MTDLPLRNRLVTRGYYALSQRFRSLLADEISWPTLATWASAQAGRTIRKADLERALERRLGESMAMKRLIEGPFRLAAEFVLSRVLKLNPFERSSQAVSRGNIKVYSEIGADFARFLKVLESDPDPAALTAFVDSLKPGPPPEGQDYLKRAFAAYAQAVRLPVGVDRSQLIFFANVCIAFHEQTRLQPDIEAGVDGAVLDGLELKDRLLELLLPGVGRSLWSITQWTLRWRVKPYVAPLVDEIQEAVREIVTEKLMVLELPDETLALKRDLTGSFPLNLRVISNSECAELLQRVDPTPDSLQGTGVRDWTSLPQRMHFITDLIRSRQGDTRLYGAVPEGW